MATTGIEIVISAKDQFSGTANRVIGSLNRMQGAAGQVGRGVGQLGAGLARVGFIAGTAAAAGLIGAAKAAIDFEDAFAGVRKTADLTETEFTALATSFRKMATEIPISASELARLGETAGALGIQGVDNIREFARVTALLGVTTNLTADAAATSLGHISTILKLTGEDYERFASALVDLGNKGASTEDQIAAIAERAAGGAATINLSTQALLGWSAAIANLGVEADAGGTNFQKFLIESAKNVAENGDALKIMAQTAGMTAKTFRQEFGRDPNSALSQFIVGLGKLNTNQRIAVLSALSWDDQRLARILLGLASNTDNLSDALSNSATAWQENSALSVEAGKRFDTIKSKLTVLRNNFFEAAILIGEGFTPALGRAADKLSKFLQVDANRASLKQLGEDIGKAIDSIDWQEVIAGAKTLWGVIKSIAGVLMAIPNDVKAIGLAFLGVNKLSGGLIGQGLGNIVGGLAGAAARGVAAKIPGVGAVFAQPVYVTNWPAGGLLGGPGGGKGGMIAPIPVLIAAVAAGVLLTGDSPSSGDPDKPPAPNQVPRRVLEIERTIEEFKSGGTYTPSGQHVGPTDPFTIERINELQAQLDDLKGGGPGGTKPKFGGKSPDDREIRNDLRKIHNATDAGRHGIDRLTTDQRIVASAAARAAGEARQAIDRVRHAVEKQKVANVSVVVNVTERSVTSRKKNVRTWTSGQILNRFGPPQQS